MLIIAGTLTVAPSDRAAYLEAVADVSVLARTSSGCLAFTQAADPNDPAVINVYERWDSDEALHAFRNQGGPELKTPPIVSADVAKYRISGVEKP